MESASRFTCRVGVDAKAAEKQRPVMIPMNTKVRSSSDHGGCLTCRWGNPAQACIQNPFAMSRGVDDEQDRGRRTAGLADRAGGENDGQGTGVDDQGTGVD